MTAIELNGSELPRSGLEFRLHLAWLNVETGPRGGEQLLPTSHVFLNLFFEPLQAIKIKRKSRF